LRRGEIRTLQHGQKLHELEISQPAAKANLCRTVFLATHPRLQKTPKVRTERAARLLAQELDSKTERHTVPDEDRRQQQNQRREKWILAHAA
jgi:hypothetical protein